MFWIWLITVIILGMIAAYQLAFLEPYQVDDIVWVVIIGVLLWPVVIAAAIIISPFALPFYLGAKKKEKLEKLEEEEKLKNKLNK
jgi:Na+/H+ antiporter NhaA